MERKSLRRGDIVLVPFPFTDFSAVKVRPAITVSPEPIGQDTIIAFITSVIPEGKGEKTEFILTLDDPELFSTGLRKVSRFRMSKLVTIDRSLIKRRLGKVGPQTQEKLDKCLKIAPGIS